jgi:hypothetical protein
VQFETAFPNFIFLRTSIRFIRTHYQYQNEKRNPFSKIPTLKENSFSNDTAMDWLPNRPELERWDVSLHH